jgi:hypothetical protein
MPLRFLNAKRRARLFVPEGQLIIAQHFNAGSGPNSTRLVLAATAEGVFGRPCRDLVGKRPRFPALKRWAIFIRAYGIVTEILVALGEDADATLRSRGKNDANDYDQAL